MSKRNYEIRRKADIDRVQNKVNQEEARALDFYDEKLLRVILKNAKDISLVRRWITLTCGLCDERMTSGKKLCLHVETHNISWEEYYWNHYHHVLEADTPFIEKLYKTLGISGYVRLQKTSTNEVTIIPEKIIGNKINLTMAYFDCEWSDDKEKIDRLFCIAVIGKDNKKRYFSSENERSMILEFFNYVKLNYSGIIGYFSVSDFNTILERCKVLGLERQYYDFKRSVQHFDFYFLHQLYGRAPQYVSLEKLGLEVKSKKVEVDSFVEAWKNNKELLKNLLIFLHLEFS